MSSRRCYVCKTVKPISEFYTSKRNGHCYECKQCSRAYKRKYRQDNYDKVAAYFKAYKAKNRERIREANRKHAKANPHIHRDYMLRKLYGISLKEYNEMLKRQCGYCAICHNETKLNVDHCHETKMVRGLLCRSCNQGIGHFMDDPTLLRSAAGYLENKQGWLHTHVAESKAVA